MHIDENTKVRFGLLIAIFGGVASTFIWVGSIQAKVEHVEDRQRTLEQKIDLIKENTDYIKGKIQFIESR